jgi:hypothetical protein
MECAHCRKWHFKGIETCLEVPKENKYPLKQQG